MKNFILSFLILVLAGCQSAVPYSSPASPVYIPKIAGIQHRVEAGQTLWRISKIYNVDIDDIVRINRISENAAIEIGQVLVIPERPILSEQPVKQVSDDFIWPLKGKVITSFGSKQRNLVNKGINIQATAGQEVKASRQGRVVFYAANLGNFGKTIIIDHGDGLRSVYSRISEIYVKP